LPGDASHDRGIGLANTRARLRQLYGEDARLEIKNCDRGGVIATMSIPFHHSHSEIETTYASDSPDRG
jgi:LytS/YehU family sensor histidine kinase